MLFLPPYSSFLSGVETLWAHLKRDLSKTIDRIPQEIKQTEYDNEVNKLCKKLNDTYDGRKVFDSARKDLMKAL